ncbi:hypothetical protein [Rhodococcus koreensis]|uniref:Uncharacterized protein n=1 Tax=Rhodococcus koreensis TaxID=99653 RepID=A0A1H4I5K5_9NOCA|nr:hypothetical protein [Rhodococcus koreensis]SEB29369.1 hypothetical protein SAMN04490239_0080 [Rhodococcus koreensis]
MAVLLIDQASVRGGGGLAVHQPMGAGHEQALAQLAREFECSDSHTESLASSITLDDGDLSWHSGDGHDILFTAVDVAGTLVVRALERSSDGWVTVADRLVDPRDAASTAHAVWQLISLLTA